MVLLHYLEYHRTEQRKIFHHRRAGSLVFRHIHETCRCTAVRLNTQIDSRCTILKVKITGIKFYNSIFPIIIYIILIFYHICFHRNSPSNLRPHHKSSFEKILLLNSRRKNKRVHLHLPDNP